MGPYQEGSAGRPDALLVVPTLGVLNFILSRLTRTPLEEIIHEMWPFLALLVAGLVALIAFPQITLFLPHLVGIRTR